MRIKGRKDNFGSQDNVLHIQNLWPSPYPYILPPVTRIPQSFESSTPWLAEPWTVQPIQTGLFRTEEYSRFFFFFWEASIRLTGY